MCSKTVLGLLVLVALVSYSCAKPNPKPGKGLHTDGQIRIPPIKCAGTDLNVPPRTLDALYSCLNKTMASLKETKDTDFRGKKDCQWVCVAQELGILDSSGKLVEQEMNAVVEEMFPETKSDNILSGFGKCATDYSSTFLLKEGDCSSYGNFIECGIKNVLQICEIEMPNHDAKSS